MPIKVEHISSLNPWDRIHCPVCGGKQFVSLDHASVWCDECNANFVVRHTAGDPGYVVDCLTKHCTSIRHRNGEVTDYQDAAKAKLPNGYAYWIDKEGDYCSGWLDHRGDHLKEVILPKQTEVEAVAI